MADYIHFFLAFVAKKCYNGINDKRRYGKMIKTDVYVPISYTLDDIKSALCAHLPLSHDELSSLQILRSSLVLKDKSNIHYRLTVGITLDPERERSLLKIRKKVGEVPDFTLDIPPSRLASRPVVVGAGPCGLFAALILAESGARPIVLERGLPVEERKSRVDAFIRHGALDVECNVQFGEGGAGTYSDGKLKVGAMDSFKMKVLREFVAAGADSAILHSTTAHLGTDKLSDIVATLREKIISLGGEMIYSARFIDFAVRGGRVFSVKYEQGGDVVTIPTENLILAIGHSAKDTFESLYARGVPMIARGFGIGVRIEHPREYINELIYGKNYDSRLETASYHLVTHLKSGRSVYSFCMCPGGTVVPAASEEGGVVTNGMSEYLRDGENSNAAFLVSVTPDDFGSTHALAGMELQRKIERAAFLSGGSDYRAPAVTMSDFLVGKVGTLGSVSPSYPIGVTPESPDKYLPDYVTSSLRESISDFDDWMPGFYLPDAVLTGAETRTTSPVRILRDPSYECEGICGVYPAGEGAGYSGGIVSSAVDGIKCALSILK